MKIIQPSVVVKRWPDMSTIEEAARVCYRSSSNKRLYHQLIKSGHTSVLEHSSISYLITCSRACSHQLVRHRIGCSYSQESQRYCNYENKGFEFIDYPGINEDYLESVIKEYQNAPGKAEVKRNILPNCTATRIFVTMNLRALLWFFELRCNSKAQSEIRELALDLEDQYERFLDEEVFLS